MNRKTSILAVLGIVVAFLLVGCGGDNGSAGSPTATASTKTTTASATLTHLPHGMSQLNWDSHTHILSVMITLTGLAPSSMHPSHIHTGSCSNQGAVIYPLTTIVADAHGNATASSTVKNITKGIPASGWYVNVHNGPGLSPDDQFLPIVCGDVANSNTATTASQSVPVMMTAAPPASKGEAAMGMATLTLSGTTLTVKLTISGLEPNSQHAAHIHTGSCTSQGAVIYPLTNIQADASGSATVMTVVKKISAIPSTGWYVNVHHSIALGTQTGFDPIACGDVKVG